MRATWAALVGALFCFALGACNSRGGAHAPSTSDHDVEAFREAEAQAATGSQARGTSEGARSVAGQDEPARGDHGHGDHGHGEHGHGDLEHGEHRHRSAPGEESGEGKEEPAAPVVASSAGSGPLPLRATSFLGADDRVAHAVYRARVIGVNHALHRVAPTHGGSASTGEGAKAFSIALASNVQGNLIECACRRGPIGGLARRATVLDRWRASRDEPLFVIDAGNALVSDPVPATLESNEGLAAAALVEIYGMLSLDALAVGPRDVAFGAEALAGWSETHALPLVSANWRAGGAALGEPWRIVERGGVRLGITSVAPDDAATSDFFLRTGVQALPPEGAFTAVRALRGADVDVVVLVVTGGMSLAERALRAAPDPALRPDIVLVSGSRRLMQAPTFVSGVPVVEASDRGRHLVRLDVTWDPTDPGFVDPDEDVAGRLREYRTLLHTVETSRERLRNDPDAPERRQRVYRSLLRRQTRQLSHWMEVLAATGIPSDRPSSAISLHLETVELTIPEREDVRARVEAARAAGWAPEEHHH